jgi:hypothetical protein
MVDRFNGLTADRASAAILETMPPPTLRHPTMVEEGKPHKETKGIRRAHLPELPGSWNFRLAQLESSIGRGGGVLSGGSLAPNDLVWLLVIQPNLLQKMMELQVLNRHWNR